MKLKIMKLFALVIGAFMSLNMYSQFTITKDTHAPKAGDSQVMKTMQAGSFDHGPSGANQTWDFSKAVVTSTLQYDYFQLSLSTEPTKYTDANVVETASSVESFYEVSSIGSNIIAQIQSGGIEVDYRNNAREFIRYPFKFGDEYNGSFSGTLSSSGFNLDRTGTTKITCDGHGTLMLPDDVTINNVMRVMAVSTYADKLSGFEVGSYIDTVMTWYAPELNNFIAMYTVVYSNGTLTLSERSYRTGLTSSSNNEIVKSTFSLSPNPAKDLITIKNYDPKTIVIFYNTLGEVIKQITLSIGQNTIDIKSLSAGIYFVKYLAAGEFKTQKLLVQ